MEPTQKDLTAKLAELKLEYYEKLEVVQPLSPHEKADRSFLTTLVLIHKKRHANKTRSEDLQQV